MRHGHGYRKLNRTQANRLSILESPVHHARGFFFVTFKFRA